MVVVADGVSYVAVDAGDSVQIYAISAANGEVVWGPASISGCWQGRLAFDAGYVVVEADYDGGSLLAGIDASTGAVAWQQDMGFSPTTAPAVYGGVAYVGGGTAAYSVVDGRRVWSTGFETATTTPAVTEATVYGDAFGTALAFNRLTGSLEWPAADQESEGGPAPDGSTALWGPFVYAYSGGSPPGVLYDPTSGASVGKVPPTSTLPAFDAALDLEVQLGREQLAAYQPGTETPQWSFGLPDCASQCWFATAPVIAGTTVYEILSSVDGNQLLAVDAANGSVLWQQALPDGSVNSGMTMATYGYYANPVAAEGKLFVPVGDEVDAYDPGTSIPPLPPLAPALQFDSQGGMTVSWQPNLDAATDVGYTVSVPGGQTVTVPSGVTQVTIPASMQDASRVLVVANSADGSSEPVTASVPTPVPTNPPTPSPSPSAPTPSASPSAPEAPSSAPKMAIQPESRKALAGATAELSAAAWAAPGTTSSWQVSLRRGAPISVASSASQCRNGLCRTLLDLHPQRSTPNARYRAVFRNASGITLSKWAAVTVSARPRITRQPHIRPVHEGATLVLRANATGRPAPAISWLLRPRKASTWTALSDRRRKLKLRRLTCSDNGDRLRAVFTNGVGHPVHTRTVRVRMRPKPCPIPAAQAARTASG